MHQRPIYTENSDASRLSGYHVRLDAVMPRRFLHNALVWLCLSLQLVASTSSAAGLLLCVEDDGSVAIETRLTQLGCCGEFSRRHDAAHSEAALVKEDACMDTPLSVPAALREASSRASDGASPALVAATTVVTSLYYPEPTRLLRPPDIAAPDCILAALSTVVLLV